MELILKRKTRYLGRNGYANCIGFGMHRTRAENAGDPNVIEICPINSKNYEGRSFVQVPVDDVVEYARALESLLSIPELMKGIARTATLQEKPDGKFNEEYCLMDPATDCANCTKCKGDTKGDTHD